MDNMDTTVARNSKKEFRRSISSKLESSLEGFQNEIKDKKFKAAIKRASKLLANDLFVKQKKKKQKSEADTVMAEAIGA
jgi:hypothetical protein